MVPTNTWCLGYDYVGVWSPSDIKSMATLGTIAESECKARAIFRSGMFLQVL